MELEEAIKSLEYKIKMANDAWYYEEEINTVLQALENSIPKKKIEEIVLHLRLLKRYVALNDEQRKEFNVCIKEVQKLLEE